MEVSDHEIFNLLSEVYVQAGFTTAEIAQTIFAPTNLKARGVLFAAKETTFDNRLAGMVIVVPWTSPAAARAKEHECELHLLAVSPTFRRHGLGRSLVETAVAHASNTGANKIILWTQVPMQDAQRLYESTGFTRCGEMTKNEIAFIVYEKILIQNNRD